MNVNEMDRDELLMELGNYHFVPGHGPDYEKMSDDELRKMLEQFRKLFKEVFKEEEQIYVKRSYGSRSKSNDDNRRS